MIHEESPMSLFLLKLVRGRVIKGWQEGLTLSNIGGKATNSSHIFDTENVEPEA